MLLGTLATNLLSLILGQADLVSRKDISISQVLCDTVQDGYQCSPEYSHHWGQYSPWFAVPSDINADIPTTCHVTFAQVLSRHASRFPTTDKTKEYRGLINHIQTTMENHTYGVDYAFIRNYSFDLGENDLTSFGQQEMINSGIAFFNRYRDLASSTPPFVRASREGRVIMSAQNWTQGYHMARDLANNTDPDFPYPILTISEDDCANNTLNINDGKCPAFRQPPISEIGSSAQQKWENVFVPPIRARVNKNLPRAELTTKDVIYLMDICAFDTVASPVGTISQFCSLFRPTEWQQYDHYQSLGKYYSFGAGNPLGPTQGVGWVNELIARLKRSPVVDDTSTNHTLDNSSVTFPLNQTLYADFSHDNQMTSIFFALGLFNTTAALSTTGLQTNGVAAGYSAAYTVPFAARAYFEKLECGSSDEEYVRVIMNGRVMPLKFCNADSLGRCSLESFVNHLTFAQEGGLWSKCGASPDGICKVRR